MKKFLFNYILPGILYVLIYVWCSTIRVFNKNPERGKHVNDLPGRHILTLWHGRIFYLFFYLRSRPDYHLLISTSVDGDLLARLARMMGYSVIRGSSYKKAVSAARSLIRILRKEDRIIIIADGSRGPRCQAQPGSIQMAGITGSPIIPMTFSAENKIVLNSWDRFILPFPFTRCTLNFGSPIHVPPKANEALIRKKQDELETALNLICSDID